jgi:DNA-binding MarR family transcriptional regulator
MHALAARLADLELTASELNTLANLADGRPRNVRELSHDTGTRATTLTGVLDRLEKRGYLRRELDAGDRRSFRLALTPAGRPVAAEVRRAVAEAEHRALAGLSARQIAGYHAVITALEGVWNAH